MTELGPAEPRTFLHSRSIIAVVFPAPHLYKNNIVLETCYGVIKIHITKFLAFRKHHCPQFCHLASHLFKDLINLSLSLRLVFLTDFVVLITLDLGKIGLFQ